MEANLTVTVFSDEYRDLVATKCSNELLIGLLIEAMELDFQDKPFISSRKVVEYLQQFAPMAFKIKEDELRKEKYWEESNGEEDQADRE